MKGLWWIKRDFRIYDNQCLSTGLEECKELLPLFCWEKNVLAHDDYSPFHLQAQWQALHELNRSLRVRGGGLLEECGEITEVLESLHKWYRFDVLYSHQETGNLVTYRRDLLVAKWCKASGATSSGGVSRIDWFLQAQPDFLILALGGNDGLRGVPVSETKENLSKILATAAKHQIPALLAGMKIPPNYGLTYTSEFAQMYQDLAEHHHIPRIPFLLEGVGGDPKFNLPDRIHPNPAGHKIIAETVYQSLARQLKTIP